MTSYSTRLDDTALAIFLFHGVIREQRYAIRNYTQKHMLRERFIAILRELRAAGHPVSMPEAVEAISGRQPLPRRAFAITFDDGFANNCVVAAPILVDVKIPATFYVTTGFIGSNTPSWTDRIEDAIEKAESVRLSLPSLGCERSCETTEDKLQLLDDIRAVVKRNSGIDPYAFAEKVCDQLGVTTMPSDPELDDKMTWGEVEDLSRHPLFTVGGHSHTHRVLEFLPQEVLEEEIARSMEQLRAHIPGPVQHYSYPEGLAHCFSDRVIRLLRHHGVVCAVTAEDGINRVGDDLFRLKRIPVV